MVFTTSEAAAVVGAVQKQIEPYIYPETKPMVAELSRSTGPAFQRLNSLVSLQLIISVEADSFGRLWLACRQFGFLQGPEA